MIGCLFNGPKKLEDTQGGSSVRGGFRVTPMRFMLQRYSHLESDREPNTIVIECSFLFSTVIYTLRYNQWFRSSF
jgi:hypothetical protein